MANFIISHKIVSETYINTSSNPYLWNIILYKENYYKCRNENGRPLKIMSYNICFKDLEMFT